MKSKIFIFLVQLISFSFILSDISTAQKLNIHKDSLYSKILEEKRPLNIVLPENYKPDSSGKYEILFCLDDISDFLRIEFDFLQGEGFIPKNMIMVGITNTVKNGVNMRERDFTPTNTSSVSGGADNFLSFFKKELIPFIIGKYNAKTGGHTLYGGSLGGLFVMYAFLSDPDLCTSYIAIDPSLWWDKFYLNKIAFRKFDNLAHINNTLFIAGREGNNYRYMGIAEMDSILQVKAPAGLDWKCIRYSGETHYSANFKGFWDGLKFSYGGFYASTGGYLTSRQIFIKPMGGIVVKDIPFRLICYNLLPGVYLHYTADGSEPLLSSPKLAGEETEISLSNDSKITVKSFCSREEYNKLGNASFKIGSVFPALLKPNGIKPGGLNYTYYEDEWEKLSDYKKLKPAQSGFADINFDINKFPKQKSFACKMEGYIEIRHSGYYIFEMGSGNDYSKVYLSDKLLLGDHFVPGVGESYMIPLEKGFYPFHIEYFYKKGGDDLQPVYLKLEGIDDFPIPSEMEYSGH